MADQVPLPLFVALSCVDWAVLSTTVTVTEVAVPLFTATVNVGV